MQLMRLKPPYYAAYNQHDSTDQSVRHFLCPHFWDLGHSWSLLTLLEESRDLATSRRQLSADQPYHLRVQRIKHSDATCLKLLTVNSRVQ